MTKNLKLTHKDLIEEALSQIETLSSEDAFGLEENEEFLFVDLRDPRELEREGKIPGAFHAPRGMLEFWVDSSSPYYKEEFGTDRKVVFYCQSGWRSALSTKTVQDMGLENVCHLGDGFRGWKEKGGPTETIQQRSKST